MTSPFSVLIVISEFCFLPKDLYRFGREHDSVGKYPSSVSHIMADLPPCMLGRTPIVRTVTAFGFGMHHFKVRIFFVYSRYCPFTVPLESDPFDIFRCGGIIEGGFGILRIIPVDCSEEYFGLNVFFFEFRS